LPRFYAHFLDVFIFYPERFFTSMGITEVRGWSAQCTYAAYTINFSLSASIYTCAAFKLHILVALHLY